MSAYVINYIGSGGKTSTILYEMEKYRQAGKKVVITSLTHMHSPRVIPEGTDRLCRTLSEVREVLSSGEIAWYGEPIKDGSCFTMRSLSDWETLLSMADVILCEGDGSRRRPVKVPAKKEPVIFPETDEIIVVAGLSALSHPISTHCHRQEMVRELISAKRQLSEDSVFVKEDYVLLLGEGYLVRMKKEYPDIRLSVILNQAGTEEEKVAARWIADEIEKIYGVSVSITNHRREIDYPGFEPKW